MIDEAKADLRKFDEDQLKTTLLSSEQTTLFRKSALVYLSHLIGVDEALRWFMMYVVDIRENESEVRIWLSFWLRRFREQETYRHLCAKARQLQLREMEVNT